jgi:hypothetical protein
MANIKQIIASEPGWEGIYVREDGTFDSPVKSAAAPLIGWALIDDENGESTVYALLSMNGAVSTSADLGPRYLGAARGGDWAGRFADHWDALAQAYMEEYGEPGAAGGEGEEGAEGEGEEPAAEEPPSGANAG